MYRSMRRLERQHLRRSGLASSFEDVLAAAGHNSHTLAPVNSNNRDRCKNISHYLSKSTQTRLCGTDEIQHMQNCETHSAYEHDLWQYIEFGNNDRVGRPQLLRQAQWWVGESVHQISVKFAWQSGWGSANFRGWSGSEGRKDHDAPQCHKVCLSALTNIFMNGNVDFSMHIISLMPTK